MAPIIRVSPSGPELNYPPADAGKVLTIDAAGNVVLGPALPSPLVADALRTSPGAVDGSASAPPEPGQVPVAIDATHFEWRDPAEPFPHLTSEYLDLLFDFTDLDSMVLTSLTGGNSVPGTWSLIGLTAVNGLTGPDGLPNATAFTEVGTAARYAYLQVANNIGPGSVQCSCWYKPGEQYPTGRYTVHANSATSVNFVSMSNEQAIHYPTSQLYPSQYALNGENGYNQ
jgi:hypothetical protein